MAWTTADIDARIERLDESLAQCVLSVRYADGKSVDYADRDAMLAERVRLLGLRRALDPSGTATAQRRAIYPTISSGIT